MQWPWIFRAAKKLRELGILGMNGRNAAYILDHNPRGLYPVVDDKMRMRDLCVQIGVPTPEVYCTISYHGELRRLAQILGERGDFVIKPNRGSAGRGVLVLTGRDGQRLHSPQRRSACASRRSGSTSPTSSPACIRSAADRTTPSCSSACGCIPTLPPSPTRASRIFA